MQKREIKANLLDRLCSEEVPEQTDDTAIPDPVSRLVTRFKDRRRKRGAQGPPKKKSKVEEASSWAARATPSSDSSSAEDSGDEL